MKINSISGLRYLVKDLDRTAEFYQLLGFRIGKRDESEVTCYINWFWVIFSVDPAGAAAAPDLGPALYLKVDDIDDSYNALLANGLSPASEPRKDRSGRKEFVLLDPDGNSLVFFTK
ncbi:VOC family protein [Plantactinospora siamensis]|uniref:VOC family protein n=1 Tax=Plantactinospora siamensis TaxID=555372 RepID=A0ABV6P3I0_9ACTN